MQSFMAIYPVVVEIFQSGSNSIYIAQYHKSQICLKGLYNLFSIQHPLSLDPCFG